MAARTSASFKAPRPRRRSNTPPRRSLRLSNMLAFLASSSKHESAGGRNLAGQRAPSGASSSYPFGEQDVGAHSGAGKRRQDRAPAEPHFQDRKSKRLNSSH